MDKVTALGRSIGLVTLGVVAGWILAGLVQKNAIARDAERLLVLGVSLSNVDGPWPAGLPDAYVALSSRKQASIYFLLAAAELHEASRPRADLYLGLLHKGSEPCTAAKYLGRAETQGVNLREFDNAVREARAACRGK